MKKKINLYFFLLPFLFISCGDDKKTGSGDTMSSGKSEIWVEEAFKPVIDEQLEVFSALNPTANLKANYGDENGIVRELLKKGSKMAIISRGLTKDEVKQLKAKNFTPQVIRFAVDAVALITNISSKDTTITVQQLKDMLSGKNAEHNIVFDNPNSGTVRLLKEFSGASLQAKNIYALKSNTDVIKYVGEHNNAIGIIGFNWLNDAEGDNAQYLKKVKVMAIQDVKETAYFKPSQTSLALKQYPLSIGVYIVNATGRLGLGTGFANFLIGERGQRILLKSELLPEQIPTREINIINN